MQSVFYGSGHLAKRSISVGSEPRDMIFQKFQGGGGGGGAGDALNPAPKPHPFPSAPVIIPTSQPKAAAVFPTIYKVD